MLSAVRKGCRAVPESVCDAVMILAALLGHADKQVGKVDQILSQRGTSIHEQGLSLSFPRYGRGEGNGATHTR